jgi:hypothetical protein
MLRNEAATVASLMREVGLTEGEAKLYLRVLKEGKMPPTRDGMTGTLLSKGMIILAGDGRAFVPVHPRLAVANSYRTWREDRVREINERRMRVDRLILELIPVYEAATEKRPKRGR